jgi:hypothetical protein
MSISYFEEATQAIKATIQIAKNLEIKGSQPSAIQENLNYALNCLSEINETFGITEQYEEDEEEQFHNKLS